MKPLSVEDGITDERKCALQSSVSSGAADPKMRWAEVVCACGERWKAGGAGSLAWVNEKFNNHLTQLLRNVRSATPEELTAQRESYGKNYKPGPRQATPFMPEDSATGLTFIPDGKGNMKIATVRQAVIENIIRDISELPDRNSPDNWPEAMLVTDKELAAILDERLEPSAPPTLPVPERTTLPTREAVEAALGIHDYPAKTIKWHLALLTEGERRILFRAVLDASVDHFEGKPK